MACGAPVVNETDVVAIDRCCCPATWVSIKQSVQSCLNSSNVLQVCKLVVTADSAACILASASSMHADECIKSKLLQSVMSIRQRQLAHCNLLTILLVKAYLLWQP
jgi:hypothetical protein